MTIRTRINVLRERFSKDLQERLKVMGGIEFFRSNKLDVPKLPSLLKETDWEVCLQPEWDILQKRQDSVLRMFISKYVEDEIISCDKGIAVTRNPRFHPKAFCGADKYIIACQKKVKVMGRFRDRDFLQTREGFFFCAVGPCHPKDRAISYLKYIPSKFGVWGKGEKRFRRVMSAYTIPDLLETYRFLKDEHSHYLYHSPFYNTTLSAVPQQYISKHYRPELKLTRLLRSSHLDPLQRRLTRFAGFLGEASKIPTESFGVTGSLLLDIHQSTFSDFDMTVYGLRNSLTLKKALTEEYASSCSPVSRLERKAVKSWCARKARRYPLTSDEAFQIYKRKWNQGVFEKTSFSIHPIKSEQEVTEVYGARTYHPMGNATLRAVVYDNTEYLFLPAVYRVKDVQIVEGPEVADIVEVVSYESLYDSIAEVEESILVKGKLERVVDNKTGREHHRVIVGSTEGKGGEYIKLAFD